MTKQTQPQVRQVFSKETGRAANYRIPAMIVTKHGTTVAAADERFYGGGDNPNRIDKVVRRSADGGLTWGEQIVVKEEVGKDKAHASAAVDPCLLYDEDADTIFMLYSHTPAGVGILSCSKGTGENERGEKLVFGDGGVYALADGALKNPDGSDSGLRADKKGNLLDAAGKYAGNIYIGDGAFREQNTSFLYLCKSEDDGRTWSEPIALNGAVKEKYMSFIGAGPGVGLKVRRGKYAGRLIFPIYYNTASGRVLMLSACVIYSDDGGVTWKRGKSPNSCRKRWGFLPMSDRFVLPNEMITETQLIELPDGRLKIFMRNHAGKRLVATAISADGGESWTDFRFNPHLPQSVCQLSVINVVDGAGREATVFLNGADKKVRRNGVIRLSYDYGETFEASARIREGEFVYSSMAQLPDGDIGVLYEGSTQHETIDFVKVSLDWIRENSYE